MSKRYLVMAAFFAGAAFGIVGLTWIGRSASSSANAVPAPEVKPSMDWIEVREYGPKRSTGAPDNRGNPGPFTRAYREQTGQRAAIYGVELWWQLGTGPNTEYTQQITLDDAEKLLALYAKFKDKTKSKAKEVDEAYVKFSVKSLKGTKLEINYNLVTQQFRRVGYPQDYDPKHFDDLEAAINDAKAMKKIPFSVKPE